MESGLKADIVTDAVAHGGLEGREVAGRRQIAARGVLGVETTLNGVTGEGDLVLDETERSTGGDAQLQLDQVEAGDQLGDAVLDLQAGVDLQEVEVPGCVEKELGRAGVGIAGSAGETEGSGRHAAAQFGGQTGGGALLNDLLMTALDGAVTLAEVQRGAVGVGDDLHFDVAPADDRAFQEEGAVAEGGLGFPARGGERVRQCVGVIDDAHAPAAPTGGGFNHDGKSEGGDARQKGGVVVRSGKAGEDWQIVVASEAASGGLVADEAQSGGRGTDEDDAGLGAGRGEGRVFREESIAGMDGGRAAVAGGLDEGRDGEIALCGCGGTDAHRFIGGAHVESSAVGVGVDGDRRDAEPLAGPDDAKGDLAAVGDEELREHG